jgi:hypothetical protein
MRDALRTLRIDVRELRSESIEVQKLFAKLMHYATISYSALPPALRPWALVEDCTEEDGGYIHYAPLSRLMARMARVVEADHGLFVRREHISRAYFYLFRAARLPHAHACGDGGLWDGQGSGHRLGMQVVAHKVYPRWVVRVGRGGVLVCRVVVGGECIAEQPVAAWWDDSITPLLAGKSVFEL